MQRGDHPLVHAFPTGEGQQRFPHRSRSICSGLHCLRPLVTGSKAEPNPARDILIGVIGGAATLELLAIGSGIEGSTEPRLDRRELRGEHPLPSDHQGLQGTRHPTIAIRAKDPATSNATRSADPCCTRIRNIVQRLHVGHHLPTGKSLLAVFVGDIDATSPSIKS
jgi:hypothetical protein